MTTVKGGCKVKRPILITLIIAIAAICIAMVIVGETEKALGVIVSISVAYVLGELFKGLFGWLSNWL